LLDVVDSQAAPGAPFKRVASTRQRADLAAALEGLASHRLTPDSPSPIVDVIRRGRTELVEVIDDEWLESSADPEAAPYWRALGASSILVLPVNAGETRAALTLIRAGNVRRFDRQQRAVSEKFAVVSAAALQNAQLYGAAQHANLARDEVLGVVSHDLR